MPSPSCSDSVLLGLVVAETFWGCFEAVLAPVHSLSVSGLASDEASGFRDHYRESEFLYLLRFHSWVLVMVAVFLLVAVGKDISARDALENNGNLHEDVDGKVIASRDAFNNIGTLLEYVDGTVTFHQG